MSFNQATLIGVRGIYAIRCSVTGKAYVGSSADIGRRWRRHVALLRSGTHHSLKLQRAWDRHGSETFSAEILEAVDPCDELFAAEQRWIDSLDSCTSGYNAIGRAGHVLPATQQQRAAMSVRLQGRIHSPEARRKLSAALTGKPKSPEHRARLSAALTGKKTGRRPSEKLFSALRGRPKSAEHREKIAAAGRGRRPSEETRAKMAQSHRARHALRKLERSNVV